jgi:hypothetical protein
MCCRVADVQSRLSAWLVVLVLVLAAPVRAQETDAEMRARTAFAAGDYKAALDIYVGLYARTMHPTYARNIGRCYQNLGEPDKAINSFKEYLRKAKGLTPEARAEIDGYIDEMEKLKARRAREAAASAAPPPASAAPKAVPEAPAPEEQSDALVRTAPAAEAPAQGQGDEVSHPFYSRWWFWTALGALAAGGVVAGLLLSSSSNENQSPPQTTFGAMSARF